MRRVKKKPETLNLLQMQGKEIFENLNGLKTPSSTSDVVLLKSQQSL
jgi:hypothetical protein